jgi:hypothetical protein
MGCLDHLATGCSKYCQTHGPFMNALPQYWRRLGWAAGTETASFDPILVTFSTTGNHRGHLLLQSLWPVPTGSLNHPKVRNRAFLIPSTVLSTMMVELSQLRTFSVLKCSKQDITHTVLHKQQGSTDSAATWGFPNHLRGCWEFSDANGSAHLHWKQFLPPFCHTQTWFRPYTCRRGGRYWPQPCQGENFFFILPMCLHWVLMPCWTHTVFFLGWY